MTTARAVVENNWAHQTVDIGLRSQSGAIAKFSYLEWEMPSELDQRLGTTSNDYRLQIPDDAARALYEALAEYYGHAGHDIRSLRKDYDSERSRVDTLIEAVIRRNNY